jgi:hypothetical protein
MVMRFPFVQVDQRYIVAQSRVVASRAAISQAEALGLGVVLFTFALESTWTDEAPPDGVFMGEDVEEILEAAIDWRGERGKAVGAFIRADVIERLQGGLRVRGMDRYREAWEKQTRRKSAAYAGASARWNKTLSDSPPIASQSHANRIDDASQSHRNRMPDASQSHAGRNAKTQTQTHKKPNQQQPARRQKAGSDTVSRAGPVRDGRLPALRRRARPAFRGNTRSAPTCLPRALRRAARRPRRG